MAIAIKVENLSKAYRLGVIGTGTLGSDLKRWYALTRGKEDPFLKIGEANDRTAKGESGVVWSLKDINLEIEQGDAMGIIGRNGAGKSTLLKILSRVTSPTTGKIIGNGRVASLLEVGTGFHPELTGKENIYLNGAILGMRKKEIARKFDEIVDFAGVERYINTPVKRYSSGMYVRLAFAVAAHLESEILIVDEVLAVGDTEFQKKCLGKMNEVSKGEGRTVLFVSHNMQAVSQLCNTGLLLVNGNMFFKGDINKCVSKYLSNNSGSKIEFLDTVTAGDVNSYLQSISINVNGQNVSTAGLEDEIDIEIHYMNRQPGRVLNLSVAVFDEKNNYAFSSPSNDQIHSIKPHASGHYVAKMTIPAYLFNTGSYYFTVMLVENGRVIICQLDQIVKIEMHANNIDTLGYFGYWGGVLRPSTKWEICYEESDI
ncbi:MAG TPA: ABC transporter ATP-binding protein [Parafilimonas sp.]|nr:ABC transporter ATP-binding protein [Parafilimonas sp.]